MDSPTEEYKSSCHPWIYFEIFKSYTFSGLSEPAREEITGAVNSFLTTGKLPDFTKAAPMLFATQPGAPGKVSIEGWPEDFCPTERNFEISRQEVLRINEELLNNTVLTSLAIEGSDEIRQAMLDEQYFAFYHYLIRYWAVDKGADTTCSPDTEKYICYENMCKSAQAIAVLQKKSITCHNKAFSTFQQPDIHTFGPILEQGEEQLDSDYVLGILRRVNEIRLCWLWDRIVIEIFVQCVHDLLLPITVFADHVSWSLYLFFASIHITGILGGYFDAKKREKELAIEARKVAWAHFKLRRGLLINDLVWGLANLACCFWLNGFGLYGYFGDLVTGILLCMDLANTIWDYQDTKNVHLDDMRRYNEQMRALISRFKDEKTKINVDDNGELQKLLENLQNFNQTGKTDEEADTLANLSQYFCKQENSAIANNERIEIIFWQLRSLYAARDNCANDWSHKQKLFVLDITYALSVLLTFSLLCCFYLTLLPISFPSIMIYIGAISTSATTILWKSTTSVIECNKIHEDKQILKREFDELIADFQSAQNNAMVEYKQQQLYLQILQKGAKIGYQEDDLLYNCLESMRTTLNSILIPVGLAMTFVFAPTSVIGIPTYVLVLLSALVTTLVVSIFIKHYFKPQDSQWVDGDGESSSQPILKTAEFESFKNYIKEKPSDNILRLIKSTRTNNNNSNLFTAALSAPALETALLLS